MSDINDYFRQQTEQRALDILPPSLREEAQVQIDVTTLIKCGGTGYEGMGCTKQFNALDKDSFYTVHGNVMKGLDGGLIGNNLNPNGTVGKVTVLCPECLIKALMLTTHEMDNAYRSSVNLALNLVKKFAGDYYKAWASGDWGNWDIEKDEGYQGAKAAIEILEAL